jgi:hypothetical protein
MNTARRFAGMHEFPGGSQHWVPDVALGTD